MHAIWKGSISFGLVNIPIALYSATHREELRFRLLRAKDLSPINYKRIAEADGKEVPWDQVVKGYEYEEGKFVVLKDEDFKRVDVEATQTVDIIDFVELEDIDPMFFLKPYYMAPAKGGEKAYTLLRDVLESSGRVGIAKVVIKTRQHLAAVKPRKKALILELMRFAEELIGSEVFKLPEAVAIGKKEREMAQRLVESMSDSWDPNKYHDDYRSALLELIRAKAKSGGKAPSRKASPARPSNVIDLVSVLQESIAQTRGGGAKRKTKAAKKETAPARRRASA